MRQALHGSADVLRFTNIKKKRNGKRKVHVTLNASKLISIQSGTRATKLRGRNLYLYRALHSRWYTQIPPQTIAAIVEPVLLRLYQRSSSYSSSDSDSDRDSSNSSESSSSLISGRCFQSHFSNLDSLHPRGRITSVALGW